MDYIALSATQLSRFSHHWFWGLCGNNKQGYSLCDAALALQQNTALRQATEASVDGFNQRPWLIRSLCWLLNYRQYRFHYYQLQGYWSLQLYQKGVTMFSEPTRTTVGRTGVFVAAVNSILTINIVPKKIRPSLKWFSLKIRSFMVNHNLITLSETPNSVEFQVEAESSQLTELNPSHHFEQTTLNNSVEISYFTVQEAMLPALTTLGMVAQVGDHIAFSTLKSAYNLARLQTHPDKSGIDNHSAFVAMTEAYNNLITQIQEQNSQTGLQSNFPFYDELEKMKEEIVIMRDEIAILHDDNIQMKMEVKQNDIKLQKIAERITRHKEHEKRQQELEKQQQKYKKRQQECKMDQEELDIALKQETKKYIIDLNKIYNFPALTEETLLAYCNEPHSFFKKISDQLLRDESSHSFFPPVSIDRAENDLSKHTAVSKNP
jgi:hypothetical protein